MQQEEHTRTNEAESSILEQGQQNATPQPEASEHHGPAGIVGILILILMIVLGGLYFWSTTTNAPVIEEPVTEQPPIDPVVESMMQLEGSNDLEAIERDLESTDLDAIDADLDQLEMELEAEL